MFLASNLGLVLFLLLFGQFCRLEKGRILYAFICFAGFADKRRVQNSLCHCVRGATLEKRAELSFQHQKKRNISEMSKQRSKAQELQIMPGHGHAITLLTLKRVYH